MNVAVTLKAVALATTLTMTFAGAEAQRWHRHYRPHRVVAVVPKSAVTVHVSNRFSQKERFAMAMAYLESHEYITVKKYSKITGLSRATAKAELDAFALDKDRPIATAMRGKKKIYIKEK